MFTTQFIIIITVWFIFDFKCILCNHPNENSDTLKIISREKWLALPPTDEINLLEPPVKAVIISHTVTNNCSSQVGYCLYNKFIYLEFIKNV